MKREETVFAALAVAGYVLCFAVGWIGAGLVGARSPWLLHLIFEAGFFATAGVLAAVAGYLFLDLRGGPSWLPWGPATEAVAKSVLAAIALGFRRPLACVVFLLAANIALFQLLLRLHGR